MSVLEFCWESQCSSGVQTGISGNFLSCIKGVKYPFEAQEGRWDFSQDAAVERASSGVEGRISWFFSSCGRMLEVSLEFCWGPQGPLILPVKSQTSIRVTRGFLRFLSIWCRGIGPP